MKKKILVLLIAVLLITACGEAPKLKNGDEAVLSFKDDKKVSVNDLYKDMKDTYALSVLIDLMDRHVLEDKYKDKIETAKNDAVVEVQRIKDMFGYDGENFNEDFFLSYLRQSYGVNTVDALDSVIYLNYLRDFATNDYVKPKITDKEITKYYEDTIVGDIEASHILIKINVTDEMTAAQKQEADDKALKTAKDIIADLSKKEKLAEEFAKTAKDKSEDLGSKADGGALGAFNKGEMVVEFENAAYALKVGEMTKEPVKSEHGYHIILKTKQIDKPKIDVIRTEIIDTLVEAKLENKSIYRVEAMTEIRKKYNMEINDPLLKEQYGQYMNYLINTANENDNK